FRDGKDIEDRQLPLGEADIQLRAGSARKKLAQLLEVAKDALDRLQHAAVFHIKLVERRRGAGGGLEVSCDAEQRLLRVAAQRSDYRKRNVFDAYLPAPRSDVDESVPGFRRAVIIHNFIVNEHLDGAEIHQCLWPDGRIDPKVTMNL